MHEPISLLFQDGVLHHGTNTALTQLALEPGTHVWDDMRDSLLPRFPDFPDRAGNGQLGNITMQADDNTAPGEVQIRWRGPLCWVTLEQQVTPNNEQTNNEQLIELKNLRRASASSPNPVWQEDASGKVCWFNQSYAGLFQLTNGRPVDPNKRLFTQGDYDAPKRVSLQANPDEKPDWYELSMVRRDDLTIYHATCINAVVAAEEAQRNFVQTLAKTFAQLSIGLAIFDRNGQLKLFNPALVDLTGLSAQFLSARPTLLSFFDQLRENRRMPEPKNYLNWRQEIAEVIAAATDGRYQETWSLESGQTYCVKGRPHPDGATAFLIEDISAEVTLTRNFRAELELGQSILDTLDDGLAVFSASGVLTFSNTTYQRLWQQDPEAAFADVTIADSILVWKAQSKSVSGWKKVEQFIVENRIREPWETSILMKDGQTLLCQLSPIASGAVLVRFSLPKSTKSPLVSLESLTTD
ncbi:MAG: PAS-domain containing protein [Sulfitobacter sp.]